MNSGGMISYLTMNVKGHYADHKNKLVLLPLTKCNESLAVYYVHLYAVAAGAQFFFLMGGVASK